MDVDVASSSSSSATDLEPPLPDVVVGSEPWHNNFPNDWLPVITRDLQTQSEVSEEVKFRQNPQSYQLCFPTANPHTAALLGCLHIRHVGQASQDHSDGEAITEC